MDRISPTRIRGSLVIVTACLTRALVLQRPSLANHPLDLLSGRLSTVLPPLDPHLPRHCTWPDNLPENMSTNDRSPTVLE